MIARSVHPLLAIQLRKAGFDADFLAQAASPRLRALVEAVGRTYADTDQAMLTVQSAERRASRELADLYRQLQFERDRLEHTVHERATELAMSQAELAEAQRLAGMGSWQYLPALRRLEVSAELAILLELDPADGLVAPADLMSAIIEEDRPRAQGLLRRSLRGPVRLGDELRVINARGDIRWFMCRLESELGPDYRVARIRGTFLDVTERRQAQESVEHLAYHDELTGLPNRLRFRDCLDRAIERSHAKAQRFGVLFLDLDGFKVINDSLGHDAGDRVLAEVARRLRDCLRDEDLLSRFGGDEFVALIEQVGGRADVAAVAQKMLSAVERPVRVDEIDAHLSGSVGVAMYPDDGGETALLLRNADAAMYACKANGRHGIHFYTPEINARSLERLEMVNELRHAIERAQFVLAFQPIVGARTGRIEGIEALVRWAHPHQGIVQPGLFIPVAEEAGLIGEIGRLVLHKSCQQLMSWRAAGAEPVYVSVNVSPAQFGSGDFVSELSRLLDETGLPADMLQLEITEGMMMRDPDRAAALLRRVKDLGVRLSLDDFGTGHSSLAYLKRFPIDVIKIDRSFVKDIERTDDDAPIIRAIIAIAASMGSGVIAEGVETETQRDALVSLGCDKMQGFLFYRPMPATLLAPSLMGAAGSLSNLGRRHIHPAPAGLLN